MQTQGLPAVQVEHGVRPLAISRNPNQKCWTKPVVSSLVVLVLASHCWRNTSTSPYVNVCRHPSAGGGAKHTPASGGAKHHPAGGGARHLPAGGGAKCVLGLFSQETTAAGQCSQTSSALVSSPREPSVQSHKAGSKQQTCLQGGLICNSVSGSSLSFRRSLQSWRYVSAAQFILVYQFND